MCVFRGHMHDRKRAWDDGLNWRSECKRCGVPMIKDAISGKWRLFEIDSDFSAKRENKPTRSTGE